MVKAFRRASGFVVWACSVT